jgi:ribosomal protein S18 acetylase RimI-like enzyme
MIVRAGLRDDAPALQALAVAVGLDIDAEAFRAQFDDPDIALYVAEEGEALIGFLTLRQGPPPACVHARRPLQLWRLYVLRDFHGKGVARSLTGRALVHAHAAGHDVVWLGTEADNARAIGFYDKCGFRAVGTADLHGHGVLDEDLILACVLDTPD